MHAHLSGNREATSSSNLLLEVGNGTIPVTELPDIINLPTALGQSAAILEELKYQVIPNLAQNRSNPDWLAQWAIISPLNDNVCNLNTWLMSEFPGQQRLHKSIDTSLRQEDAVHYPVELLNSLVFSGIPFHLLKLKPGAPIIILRSLDPPKTTNGTQCVVTRLHDNMIKATISCGPCKCEVVLVPRILLKPSDTDLPFEFKRLQFPVKPAYALTADKSQGQTFEVMGADLTLPCLTHGMCREREMVVWGERNGCVGREKWLCGDREMAMWSQRNGCVGREKWLCGEREMAVCCCAPLRNFRTLIPSQICFCLGQRWVYSSSLLYGRYSLLYGRAGVVYYMADAEWNFSLSQHKNNNWIHRML